MTKITIIAEAGICHNGDMHLAKALIREAKWCGCEIFKTQVYSVDALFPDHQIVAQNRNWYEEVKKTELTKEQVFELADYCAGCGIEFMCSAFDTERLGWLEEIGVKRHKVAARFHLPELADFIISTRKPILVSLPYNNPSPILWPTDRTQFLYCVPEYPAPLSSIKFPKFEFEMYGYSDHTIGIEASMIAMARGATIIEKHFSLDPSSKAGPDHICSANPMEMHQLVQFARKVEEVL